jgi:ribonuclease P protein component
MRSAVPHLRKRADFLRVAATRRRWTTPGLMLQVAPRPADTGAAARVGYTASRKVGNAVVRNRSRRRLRAAVAALMPDHGDGAFDYVLIAREATAKRPWPELLADVETAMRRLKAWREASPAS